MLNIVGQQLPTLLDVTCCMHWYTLLHVVVGCWELLYPFAHHHQHGHTTTNLVGGRLHEAYM